MKMRYSWWPYVRDIIRAYPARKSEDMTGVSKQEFESVQATVEATERMGGGEDRLKVIRMVHWDRTHTLEGAALSIPCSRRTAAYWQREFFEEVAKKRGLFD